MNEIKRPGALIAFLALVTGIAYMGYKADQQNFWSMLIPYLLAFGGYLFFVWRSERMSESLFRLGIGTAVVLRVILLFSFPLLSDDIYRFYWDGLTVLQGLNPYDAIPSQAVNRAAADALTEELFILLNSPDWHSVYPPLDQLLFGLGAWLSPKSIFGFSLFLKGILLLAEISTILIAGKILSLLGQRRERVLLYALNPLVLIEIMGNLHFEGLIVLSMGIIVWAVLKNMPIIAGLSWGLAGGLKLVPLILLPALWRFMWARKDTVTTWIVAMLVLALSLSPILIMGSWSPFLESIDLYFRSFEFNASLYYLLRKLGFALTGWNQIALIGPALSAVFLLWNLYYSFKPCKDRHPRCWISAMIVVYTFFLLFSTTVHPWYLSVPLFLSMFTRFRFVYTWSLLVILSYSHYHLGHNQEIMPLLWLEYGAVILSFVWEWSRDCSLVNLLMDEEIEV